MAEDLRRSITWLIVSIVMFIIILLIISFLDSYSGNYLGPKNLINAEVTLFNDPTEIWEQISYKNTDCTIYKFNFTSPIPSNIIHDPIDLYEPSYNSLLLDNIPNNAILVTKLSTPGSVTENNYIYGPLTIASKRTYKCLQDSCIGYDGKKYLKDETVQVYTKCSTLNTQQGNDQSYAIDINPEIKDPNAGSITLGNPCFISIFGQYHTTKQYIDYYGDFDATGDYISSSIDRKAYLLKFLNGNPVLTNLTDGTMNDLNKLFYVIRGTYVNNSFSRDDSGPVVRIIKFSNTTATEKPLYLGFQQLSDIIDGATPIFTSDDTQLINWQLIPSYGLAQVQTLQGTNETPPNNCSQLVSQYTYQKIAITNTPNPKYFNDYSSYSKTGQKYFCLAPQNSATVNSNVIIKQINFPNTIGFIQGPFGGSPTCQFSVDPDTNILGHSQIINHDQINQYNQVSGNPMIKPFMNWNPYS
jgi:hypothetical protein